MGRWGPTVLPNFPSPTSLFFHLGSWGHVEALLAYRTRAPHARRAHPTEEHYLQLLVALGASVEADAPQWIDGGITDGVLSMDSFAWGLPVREPVVA